MLSRGLGVAGGVQRRTNGQWFSANGYSTRFLNEWHSEFKERARVVRLTQFQFHYVRPGEQSRKISLTWASWPKGVPKTITRMTWEEPKWEAIPMDTGILPRGFKRRWLRCFQKARDIPKEYQPPILHTAGDTLATCSRGIDDLIQAHVISAPTEG